VVGSYESGDGCIRENSHMTVGKFTKSRKMIGCKWIFTVKYSPTGFVDRYKD
jgi:hypothetical protein